ncbi:PTS sugar transporter subunit IIB [Gaopeijia maritima]|uniref:PTS sugar transporter subunit IIB n=1 Tax=Gaopeijia maritima TaxID=3119007 RepID=A0ABU9EAU1_9BACT
MSIVLYRVDERLIHGQVVLGWGGELHPRRYIVVDDALADSEWEQDLYRLAVPDDTEVLFRGVAEAREALTEWAAQAIRTVLLTRDVSTMAALGSEGGLGGVEVNLGGIHHRPGRTEVRPYLFIGDEEREGVRSLVAGGVHVSGRDLPGGLRVDAEQILG